MFRKIAHFFSRLFKSSPGDVPEDDPEENVERMPERRPDQLLDPDADEDDRDDEEPDAEDSDPEEDEWDDDEDEESNIIHMPLPKRRQSSSESSVREQNAPPVDSKGFHILDDGDNLEYLFAEDEYRDRMRRRMEEEPGDDDFATLFAQTENDRFQQFLMDQKKSVPTDGKQKPVTVRERIKSYPAPQDNIDLHGFTSNQAGKAAELFIRRAVIRGLRTVEVIVGKGLHSQGRAVLPDLVERKLSELKREGLILAYEWDKKDKQKSGSLIVYLIRPQFKEQ